MIKLNTIQRAGAAAILLGALATSASAAPNWRWQPHFDWRIPFLWWWTINTTVTWTDADGNPMPNPTTHTLPFCEHLSITPPDGAEDVDHWTRFRFIEGEQSCDSFGRIEAIRRHRSAWQSDMSGFYTMIQQDGLKEFDFRSGFVSQAVDKIYWSVDLFTYYASRGGLPVYDPGTQFNVVDGLCDALPGYLFSTSPIVLNAETGLAMQGAGFTGTLTSAMEEGICPTPGPWALVGLASFVVARRRR
ncbi:MAG TPA: hypothetical protein VF777_13240 [Phycisphaerales bacterium]